MGKYGQIPSIFVAYIIGIAILLLPFTALADSSYVVTIDSQDDIEDNFMDSDNNGANNATDTELDLGEFPISQKYHPWLKFDNLETYLDSSHIFDSIKFIYYWTSSQAADDSIQFKLARCMRNTVVNQQTWDDWSTSNGWTLGGARDGTDDSKLNEMLDGDFYASESVVHYHVGTGGQYDTIYLDLDIVKQWSAPDSNFGFVFRGVVSYGGINTMEIRSEDHASSANRPKMVAYMTDTFTVVTDIDKLQAAEGAGKLQTNTTLTKLQR
jgi:hypothetical protein